MKIEKRNFRVKMHLACGQDDLRPVMTNVFFDNGFMVATDAHVLVKAKIDSFSSFDVDEIKLLEGKFLCANSFKKVMACKQVRVIEEGIEDLKTKTIYKFAEVDGKYPNYQAILSGLENKELSEIAFSPSLVKRVMQVCQIEGVHGVSAKFYGANKQILVHLNEHSDDVFTALFMPVMLNNKI